MKLTGKLKEKNEQTETKENAAMELNDDELDQVAGGEPLFRSPLS